MGRKAARDSAASKPRAPAKRASKSTTPTRETLAALDAATLIRLVLDETGQNPAFKKRVSAALAGLQGPDAVAALIDRRLAALEKARGFIDWRKSRTFVADLDAMLATIVSDLRPLDAGMALDRLVRFLDGANATLERAEDSAGRIEGLYDDAVRAAVEIVRALPPTQVARVAENLVPMIVGESFGLLDGLLQDIVAVLPAEALGALDAQLVAALAAIREPTAEDRAKANPYDFGPAYAIRMERLRLSRLREAIADARGDVDAFIAIESRDTREPPDAIAIAERLLAAGRAGEALDWIRRPYPYGHVGETSEAGEPGWRRECIEIQVLDALGQHGEAQALRWSRFERVLDPQALRDYLAKLPDFEDEDALERAFAYASAQKDPHGALFFLVGWPQLDRAAKLVMARRTEWEGRFWQWLAPAAEALEHDHPLAASLLHRALLDDILDRSRHRAYGHGARHLAALEDLAARLEPGDLTPGHAAYEASLRKAHRRKSGFWDYVDDV
ncbi:DUF6880 family protein [Methylobacterium haplocladii]|nr:DUF6880 family protein [Methylobacterium haplocladii]GJD82487.1 hypothetical protein HPGCJGGD_0343 [Methylobacterium haplocladii]GLS59572.1 hypothetical protein GCM10007887_22410 [Methylobacterium haplocladii]